MKLPRVTGAKVVKALKKSGFMKVRRNGGVAVICTILKRTGS